MPRAYFDPDASRYRDRRKSASASHKLDYHIVIRTKWRRGVLTDAVVATLVDTTREICEAKRYLLLGFAVRPEHVHMLMGLAPDVPVSEAVRNFKGITAARLRKDHGLQSVWADGYFVESVGWKNPAQIKAYLDRQDEHHAGERKERSQGRPEGESLEPPA